MNVRDGRVEDGGPAGCPEMDDLLALYGYGDVSDDERARVHAHLRDCAGCRDALAEIRATLDLVSSAPGLHVDALRDRALQDRIIAAADAPSLLDTGAAPRRSGVLLRWAAAAAAVVIVCLWGGSRILQPVGPAVTLPWNVGPVEESLVDLDAALKMLDVTEGATRGASDPIRDLNGIDHSLDLLLAEIEQG